MTTYLAQANTGADALASTRSVTKPAGVTAGAVGVFWLVRWHESGSFPAVTAPAGAVLRGTITTASMQTQCYLHRVTAETAFAYSWTSGRWSTLAGLWFSGVDPTLDLATVPFQSATGSGTAIGALTVTTSADSALAWHVNTIDTSGVTHNPPAGFTEVADVSPAAAAYRITVASGSQDATGATVNPTTAWAAGLVALAPAAASGATGDAALAGTAALAATGRRATAGSTALAGTANLTGSGTRQASATASLTATAGLAADGTVSSHTTGDATLSAVAALTAGGQRAAIADTELTGTADLTADGLVGRAGQGALAAEADLAAGGVHGTLADTGLTAVAALTAQGTTTSHGPAALTATVALAASGATLGSGRDDTDVTVGAPYSPWTAEPPRLSVWTMRPPHASSWKVGSPC